MQIAHPLVAAGVAEHSQFRTHRFARLYRTSMAAAAITFGSREFALRAIRSINQRHQQVHGVLREQAGVFPAGTAYDANDPELKLWVMSTITDSTLLVYDRFVAPLSDHDREDYYLESLVVARLFAIPDNIMPPTYVDFRSYMNRLLHSDVITVSDTAREIVTALFAPSIEGALLRAGSAAGIALLPERMRAEFGFPWSYRREKRLNRFVAGSRWMRGHVPSILCSSPFATLSHLRALVAP